MFYLSLKKMKFFWWNLFGCYMETKLIKKGAENHFRTKTNCSLRRYAMRVNLKAFSTLNEIVFALWFFSMFGFSWFHPFLQYLTCEWCVWKYSSGFSSSGCFMMMNIRIFKCIQCKNIYQKFLNNQVRIRSFQ